MGNMQWRGIEFQGNKKTWWIKLEIKDGNSGNPENSSNQQEKFKSLTEFYDNLLKNFQSKMTPAQLNVKNMATSDGASVGLSSS